MRRDDRSSPTSSAASRRRWRDVLRQLNSLLGHAEVQTVRTATVTESGAQGNFLTLTEG